MPPSTNDVAAAALEELAELVSITGGDPYRARAYEKAARAVAAYPSELQGLDAKALDRVPSVGARIAAKLQELLATGHIGELDELRASVPAGVRSLLAVPGPGPKHARQLHEGPGVSPVPQLVDALSHERLRGLRGWGPTSEARLAAAIRQLQEAGGRLQLGVALELAEQLVAMLRAVPEVSDAAYAGSLRRMCETIGDIDLLAASTAPDAVMAAFARFPLVAEVPALGTTKAMARTTSGVHVDLRVVAPGVYGAALLYFTGSKAHNIHLRRIAQRKGCKLSEYGLERIEDGTIVAARTEAEVYGALGCAFVPPTLREDRGEIEAAAAGALPELVRTDQLRGDLHTHTNLTDGLASLEEMVAAARARHYAYFGVTDHAPLLSMQRMTRDKALAQRAALRRLEKDTPGLRLLHGSELNIQPDGSLDWDDAFLAGFDVLVASVHSAFSLDEDAMTRRLVAAVEHPAVNILGHPTARSIGHRPPIRFDAEAVFTAAARAGTALEINCFPDRLDLNDELGRLALDLGAVFAVSSDAHAIRHLDNLRYGIATAQRAWIPAERVINTWPLDRLERFLDKRDRG